MADRTVLVTLRANIADFRSKMSEAERTTERYGKTVDGATARASTALGRMVQSADANREAWDRSGTALAAMGTATVATLYTTARAAVAWESQFAGVEKTVDGTAAQLGVLEGELRGLARTLPASQREVAAVAEAAGQLGIKREGITRFTRTMVDLGETTNLSADEAATAIAQMANVMDTSVDDIDNVGSALVALGNNGASTERDIVQMALRISGAGRQINLTEGEVLGFASALASVGIEAEAGGTAISRVMISTRTAVEEGGDALETMAETAGMTGAEFKRAFEEDAGGAIIAFIQGLGDLEEQGQSTTGILDELGFSDIRVADALRRAAADSDGFTAALQLGNQAFEDNTALAAEAEKRYETTGAKLEIARNNATDAAISFGEVLLPAVESAAEGAADLAGWLSDLDEGQQRAIVSAGGVAGSAALMGGAFLLAFPRVIDTYQAFRDLRDISPRTADGVGRVGKAAGVTAAALTALSIADSLFSESGMVQSSSEATRSLTGATVAAEDLDEQVRELTENSRTMSNLFTDARGFDSLEQGLSSIADPGLLDRLADVNREITSMGRSEGRAARDTLVRQLEAQGQALATLAQSGNAELAADQFEMFEEAAEKAGMPIEDLLDLMPAYRDALADLEVEKNLAGVTRMSDEARTAVFGLATEVESVGVLAPAAAAGTGELTESVRLLGDVSGWTEEQVAEAQAAVEEWQTSLQGVAEAFVEPLSVYKGLLDEKTFAEQEQAQATADATEDAGDSWEDYVEGVSVSLDEYAARLEEQNAAQATWRENLVKVTQRGGLEVGQILADMGAEGAQITADMADATDAEFTRMAEALIADARYGGKEAAAALDTEMRVMEEVAKLGAYGTKEAIAKQLGIGVDEVAAIAERYGVELADGINPLLGGLGKAPIRLVGGQYKQGSQTLMASGGVLPGWTPGTDVHEFYSATGGRLALSGGEAIMRPEWVAQVGRDYVDQANAAARSGVRLPQQRLAAGGFFTHDDVPRPSSTGRYGPPLSTAGRTTMRKGYDETREWLEQNMERTYGGGRSSKGYPGTALARVQGALLPGLRITSTYRSPAHNARVGGSPTSLHMDRSNPAVDVAGPVSLMDRQAAIFRSMGGWRQLLYRVAGHFDHIHAADRGGVFKGPGVVRMGDGYESMIASGLRPAQKVADLHGGGMVEQLGRLFDVSGPSVAAAAPVQRVPSAEEVAAALAAELRREPIPAVAYLDGRLVTERVSHHQQRDASRGRRPGA